LRTVELKPELCVARHNQLDYYSSVVAWGLFNNGTGMNLRAVWARERCRTSPPRFLAECRKRRLKSNEASFVLLCFVLLVFCVVFSFCIVCIFNMSSVLYFPA